MHNRKRKIEGTNKFIRKCFGVSKIKKLFFYEFLDCQKIRFVN